MSKKKDKNVQKIILERIKQAIENNQNFLDLSLLGLNEIPEDIAQLPELEYLFLDHNQIIELEPLRQLKNLKTVSLSHNKIETLPPFLLELGVTYWWKDISIVLLILELLLARALARTLDRILDRDLALTLDRALALGRSLGLDQVLDLDRALDLSLDLDRALDLGRARTLDQVLDQALAGALALDRTLSLALDQALTLALDLALDRALARDLIRGKLIQYFLPTLETTITGIYLLNNPLKSPSPELIMQGDTAVKVFYSKLSELKAPLNEVKVILVGEGGSGKTSVVRRLCQNEFDKNESKTHGIRISKQLFTYQNQSFRANFWDFGGQEIMHATHQFFLTKRCLYILVLDSRKDEKAEYWLNYIQSFGGDSPVLVVINKIDENPAFNVNRVFLSKKYSNIQGYYKVSCEDRRGLVELKEDILKSLWNLELREYILPTSWVKVKSILETMSEDFIGYAQYQKICQENEVTDEPAQKVLLDLLNDLGVVLNYEKLRLFDTQVLNPLWLTNAVYRIINSPILAKANGRFNINDLNTIINDARYQKENPKHWENISNIWRPEQQLKRFPEEKFLFIVAMMKQFEILFQLDDYHYLVPALLPDEEESNPFTEEEGILSFMIEYRDFLPAAIIPRFMVKLHKYIYKEKCWKTGMVLEEKISFNSIANVVLDKESRKIYINIVGKRRRDFLTVIRETIREINLSFQNLDVLEWVVLPDGDKRSPVWVEYQELHGYERYNKEEYFSGKLMRPFPVTSLLNGVEKPEIRQGLRPCHIFISYSYQDQKHKEKLLEHLSPLFRLNRVTIWDNTHVEAGAEWYTEIFANLEKAHIVLCLISSGFIKSDFCYTKELEQSIEAHKRKEKVVIPILIKQVNWDRLPIAQIQGLPKNKWIKKLSNHKAWTEIAKGIEEVIDKITSGK